MPLTEFLPANLFAVFLIFARIGTMMMLMPGFGEVYVLQRYRLLLALFMAALLTPVLLPVLPPLPGSPARLAVIVGGEIAIGAFIGTVARMLVSALETAGTVVSLQLGLSAAAMFNPLGNQDDAPLPSALLGVMGVVLIFVTNLHEMLLRAAVESYGLFTPGALPPLGDFSNAMAHIVAGSFRLGIELASPFIVLGLVFFLALGLVTRMVPQLQVMFIAQPLQIIVGLFVFAAVLVTGMRWFLDEFVRQFAFLGGN